MGKPKKQVYVYLNREYLGLAKSITEAARMTNVTPSTVQLVLKGKLNTITTKHGYYYSFIQLTGKELNNLPISKYAPLLKHNDEGCVKIVDKFEYEVDCNQPRIFHFPRSKEDRIALLKKFIYTKLYTHWQLCPKKIATLERSFVNEILNAI